MLYIRWNISSDIYLVYNENQIVVITEKWLGKGIRSVLFVHYVLKKWQIV